MPPGQAPKLSPASVFPSWEAKRSGRREPGWEKQNKETVGFRRRGCSSREGAILFSRKYVLRQVSSGWGVTHPVSELTSFLRLIHVTGQGRGWERGSGVWEVACLVWCLDRQGMIVKTNEAKWRSAFTAGEPEWAVNSPCRRWKHPKIPGFIFPLRASPANMSQHKWRHESKRDEVPRSQ